MNILVINTGSSSIKYKLFEMKEENLMAEGFIERIGEMECRHVQESSKGGIEKKLEMSDHRKGLAAIIELLSDPEHGVIRDRAEIAAVGHRVVHGGETFSAPAIIDDSVIEAVKKNAHLAPLHNPHNLTGIQTAMSFFPEVPHVAVFDTAFHQTLPPYAYHYGLPYEFYEKHRVRRYGFHGTSHFYVAKETAAFLDKKLGELNLIVIHLGNGASVTAIENGRSIDTSMGLTPLEGLLMGTRCGGIDPDIPFYLSENHGMSIEEIHDLLNKQSGLKGLCGANDMRDVLRMVEDGDERARLALGIYSYRIKKYIGAYYAVLGCVDAVVFTAGIGQNVPVVRDMACSGLERLGIVIDCEKNRALGRRIVDVSPDDSPVRVLVVPTNEELEIARRALDMIPQ